ncbi:hypothetical protein SAY87_030625 [Trapa incisa]|uniref:Ethylene receptor 1-like N-terminal domain-containing protein n=1 Tax=Trapa incisa TaxID=236973 RepID=A0AAN7KTG6_9MYRT|nr:hypothetical protein SAY87_030625 [Trapa incisa]
MLETRISQSSFGRLLMLTQLLKEFRLTTTDDRCGYHSEGTMRTLEAIFQIQRTCDVLIMVTYFSIPIELFLFVSCSIVPFKWVLYPFIALSIICGPTHLINQWASLRLWSPPLPASDGILHFLEDPHRPGLLHDCCLLYDPYPTPQSEGE